MVVTGALVAVDDAILPGMSLQPAIYTTGEPQVGKPARPSLDYSQLMGLDTSWRLVCMEFFAQHLHIMPKRGKFRCQLPYITLHAANRTIAAGDMQDGRFFGQRL